MSSSSSLNPNVFKTTTLQVKRKSNRREYLHLACYQSLHRRHQQQQRQHQSLLSTENISVESTFKLHVIHPVYSTTKFAQSIQILHHEIMQPYVDTVFLLVHSVSDLESVKNILKVNLQPLCSSLSCISKLRVWIGVKTLAELIERMSTPNVSTISSMLSTGSSTASTVSSETTLSSPTSLYHYCVYSPLYVWFDKSIINMQNLDFNTLKTTCYISSCVGNGHSDGFFYPGLFMFRITIGDHEQHNTSTSSFTLSYLLSRVHPMEDDVSLFVKQLLEIGMSVVDVTSIVAAYTTETYMTMRERYNALLYKDLLRV